MKKDESLVSLFLPAILFFFAVLGAYAFVRAVPEYAEFVSPEKTFLESARRVRELDDKIAKIGFVSSTLRNNVTEKIAYVQLEKLSLATDSKTQLIDMEAEGALRASKVNSLLQEFDRPGVYAESIYLESSVNFVGGEPEDDPVVKLKIKASLLPRRSTEAAGR